MQRKDDLEKTDPTVSKTQATDRNSFQMQIGPKPISACDIVKTLLSNKTHIQQDPPYDGIKVEIEDGNFWYTAHPLLNRAKYACDLGMVVDPLSLSTSSPTFFIEKKEHAVRYQEAVRNGDSYDKYMGGTLSRKIR